MPRIPGKSEAMVVWGVRLQRARKALGLQQKDLAELAGLEPGTVSAWEKGRAPPDLYFLMRLAQVYGVDEAYILRGRLDVLTPDLRRKVQSDGGE